MTITVPLFQLNDWVNPLSLCTILLHTCDIPSSFAHCLGGRTVHRRQKDKVYFKSNSFKYTMRMKCTNNYVGLYFVVHLMNEWDLQYGLSSWLAIISRWGPYWAGDIRVHAYPHFRFRLMTNSESTYVDWWCQGHHCPSTALINWFIAKHENSLYFPTESITHWALALLFNYEAN